MPKLVACGSRESAYDRFRTAHENSSTSDYVALLIDSEDPLSDIEKTWDHLQRRDGWTRPEGSQDAQVMFMTTCMETWIVADRDALRKRFGQRLQESSLPPLDNLESRSRQDIQNALTTATRGCPEPYAKGPQSFGVVGLLNPDAISPRLPSFRRARGLLGARLRD